MKVFLIIILLFLTIPCFASDGDLTVSEQRLSIVKWELSRVNFYVQSKNCDVIYEKIDENGNNTGEKIVNFADTEFVQLIQAINNGDNIKNTIMNAVKLKLGI